MKTFKAFVSACLFTSCLAFVSTPCAFAGSKAGAEMTRATFEASVTAARDAKAKIAAIMEKLDVKAS